MFNHVQIRAWHDSFTLEWVHIDTDEANAAKIATGDTVRMATEIEKKSDRPIAIGRRHLIGKVVGSVVSTRKCENLVGNKCMIVVFRAYAVRCKAIIAIDKISPGDSSEIGAGGTGQCGENRKRYAGHACRCGNRWNY